MFQTYQKKAMAVLDTVLDRPRLATEDVWDVLERFTREIGRSQDSRQHKRLALEAIRDGIRADVVYWYSADPTAATDSRDVLAKHELPASWCSRFARTLLAETPGADGRLLRTVLPPGPCEAPCQPHSAALVRVSRTQASWLVALSLNQGRCFTVTELRIMVLIRQILRSHRRRCDMTNRMSETLSWLIQCLTSSIDAHVPHAHGHSERVANIAVELGKRIHLPRPVLSDLYFAGLLHDIGLTHVQQSVLLKPGRLSDEEYKHVRTYPVIGDSILADIKPLAHLRPAVRHHHEHYDGHGHPDGLSGADIPLMARIVGVAEAFEAMHSPRPYRPALASARIEEILTEGAGRQWDPQLVEHLMRGRPHFDGLCRSGVPSQVAPAVEQVVDGWNVHSSGKVECGTSRGLSC